LPYSLHLDLLTPKLTGLITNSIEYNHFVLAELSISLYYQLARTSGANRIYDSTESVTKSVISNSVIKKIINQWLVIQSVSQ